MQTKAALYHLALFFRQLCDPYFQIGEHVRILQQIAGIGVAFVRYGIDQCLFGVPADRDINRGHTLVELEHALDILQRFIQQVGYFFSIGFMVQ